MSCSYSSQLLFLILCQKCYFRTQLNADQVSAVIWSIFCINLRWKNWWDALYSLCQIVVEWLKNTESRRDGRQRGKRFIFHFDRLRFWKTKTYLLVKVGDWSCLGDLEDTVQQHSVCLLRHVQETSCPRNLGQVLTDVLGWTCTWTRTLRNSPRASWKSTAAGDSKSLPDFHPLAFYFLYRLMNLSTIPRPYKLQRLMCQSDCLKYRSG